MILLLGSIQIENSDSEIYTKLYKNYYPIVLHHFFDSKNRLFFNQKSTFTQNS